MDFEIVSPLFFNIVYNFIHPFLFYAKKNNILMLRRIPDKLTHGDN